MSSWISNRPIPLRDEGSQGTFETSADGGVILDEDGKPKPKLDPITRIPIDPPRNAWPVGVAILVRPRIKAGDYELAQHMAMDPQFSGRAGEATNVAVNVKIMYQPLVWAALMIVGFQAPPRYENEIAEHEGKETPGWDTWLKDDGTFMEMPPGNVQDFISERIEVAEELGLSLCGWINTEITRMADDPLPGTTPVNGTSAASGRGLTLTSRSSKTKS